MSAALTEEERTLLKKAKAKEYRAKKLAEDPDYYRKTYAKWLAKEGNAAKRKALDAEKWPEKAARRKEKHEAEVMRVAKVKRKIRLEEYKRRLRKEMEALSDHDREKMKRIYASCGKDWYE